MEDDGIFYGQLVHFMVFYYILCAWFANFPPVLVFCTKKNLATLQCALHVGIRTQASNRFRASTR
jgi:hypothetical protein